MTLLEAYNQGDDAAIVMALRRGETIMVLPIDDRTQIIAVLLALFDEAVQTNNKGLVKVVQHALSQIPISEIERVKKAI